MNLFGIEIGFARRNGKYVAKQDCDKTTRGVYHRINEVEEHLHTRLDDLKNHINTRFDDVKDFIRNKK